METGEPGYLRVTFARNMLRLRKARGWSQERLAQEAGLPRSYVGDIERSDRNLSMDNIEKIVRAFGVKPVDLFYLD